VFENSFVCDTRVTLYFQQTYEGNVIQNVDPLFHSSELRMAILDNNVNIFRNLVQLIGFPGNFQVVIQHSLQVND
jgi:hypothetical protein